MIDLIKLAHRLSIYEKGKSLQELISIIKKGRDSGEISVEQKGLKWFVDEDSIYWIERSLFGESGFGNILADGISRKSSDLSCSTINDNRPATDSVSKKNRLERRGRKSGTLEVQEESPIEKIIREELNQIVHQFRNKPFGIYYLTERIEGNVVRDKFGLEKNIATTVVYDLLPEEEKAYFSIPRIGTKTFRDIKEFLLNNFLKNQDTYCSPIGLYFLARDLRDLCGIDISLDIISDLIGNRKKLKDLIGIDDEDVLSKWKPKRFPLKLEKIDAIIEFLKQEYKRDSNNFFQRYGSEDGMLNFCDDIRLKLDVDVPAYMAFPLINNADALAKLLEINDKDFMYRWNPGNILVNKSELEEATSFLKEMYLENPEEFFRLYNCRMGVFNLSRDLFDRKGIDISPGRLFDILGGKRRLASLMGIRDDGRFKNWDVKYINISRENIEEVISFVKSKCKDKDRFIDDYGRREGCLYLLRDLENERGLRLSPAIASSMLGDAKLISEITGISEDDLGSRWKAININISNKHIDGILKFLKHHYDKNPDKFFEDYGGELGVKHLIDDLSAFMSVPNTDHLSIFLNDGKSLERLLGVEDERFEDRWMHKFIYLSYNTTQTVLDYLRKEYVDNNEMFFERYGSSLGVLNLAKDLKLLEGIDVDMGRLCHLVLNGDILSKFLDVSDERFEKGWKPRRMLLDLRTTMFVIDFLAKKYSENRDAFFLRYGCSLGTRNMTMDLKKENININNLHLNTIVKHGKDVSNLLGVDDPRFDSEWHPRSFYSLEGKSKFVLEYLKEKYNKDQNKFFDRYGSRNGVFYLGDDLINENRFHTRLQDINPLLHDGIVLSQLLEIEDERFKSRWSPKVINMKYGDIKATVKFLREKYDKDPDRFFVLYGSGIGNIVLTKELNLRYNLNISPLSMGTLINKGRDIAELIGLEDKRFETRWKPKSTRLVIKDLESLLGFLKEEYCKDRDKFFKEYNTPLGSLRLCRSMRSNGLKLDLPELSDLILDGDLIATILGIEDERFSKDWRVRELSLKLGVVENIEDILKNEYKSSPDYFFEVYGGPSGCYSLARLLENKYHYNINLANIAQLISKGSIASEFLGIDDLRFETHWKPRHINIDYKRLNYILEYMRKRYYEDRGVFFERYGIKQGSINLAKDLKKDLGISISSFRLFSLMNKGDIISEMLGIKDDKFQMEWSNREFGSGLKSTEIITDFLKDKYKDDPNKFFERYGSIMGCINLAMDLRVKGVFSNLMYLSTFMHDGKVLSSLLEINDERFNSDKGWNPKSVYHSLSDLENIVDFLVGKYNEDRASFFNRYGIHSGGINFAKDLKKHKNIVPNLLHLSTLLVSNGMVRSIIGIEDPKFENEWHPYMIRLSLNSVEHILDMLSAEYYRDKWQFFERYGTAKGGINVSRDLLKRKGQRINPSECLDLICAYKGGLIKELLNIDDKDFDEHWHPKWFPSLSLPHIDFIMDYLRKRYDDNKDDFFDIYGSRFGTLILYKELQDSGLNMKLNAIASFLSKGKALEKILEVNDERFKMWRYGSLSDGSSYKKINTWMGYLSEDLPLPPMGTKIDGDIKDYLLFRREIVKGDISLNCLLTFIKTFASEHYEDISKNIYGAVERDKKVLEDILLIKDLNEVKTSEEDYKGYTEKVGKLLYSFDKDIRDKASRMLTELYACYLPKFRDPQKSGCAQDALLFCAKNYDIYALHPLQKGYVKPFDLYMRIGINLRIKYMLLQKEKMISLDTSGKDGKDLYNVISAGEYIEDE